MKVLLAFVLMAVACSMPDKPPAAPVVRTYDSAGITIVVNRDWAPSDSLLWSIDSLPAITIGSTDGAEPYLFSRTTGVLRLSNGNIVVGDAASAEIRIFDSAGVYLRRFGGLGQGPGEYTYFRGVRRYPGDSLFVSDHEGLRAHVVAPDGRELRRFRPRVSDSARNISATPTIVGIFNDGTLLVTIDIRECSSRKPEDRQGYCETTASVFQLSEDGRVLTDHGKMLSSRSLSGTSSSGKSVGFGTMMTRPFIRQFGDHFYYVDGGKPEIRVFHKTGGLVRIIRLPATSVPRKFTVAHVPEVPPAVLASPLYDGPNTAELREVFAKLDVPEMARYFSAMQIDLEGNIWLEESKQEPTSDLNGTNRWRIIDSTGVLVANVVSPSVRPGSPLFSGGGWQIGRDYILGSGSNADGAAVVRLYRLQKLPKRD